VGLAAAAHLASRSIPFIVFESAPTPGANLLDWGHVKVFSPWKYILDKASEALLYETQWQKPEEEALATGKEIVTSYLAPLSRHPRIAPYLNL
jgi:cation diffusion facilitator CzcD-associated flavoprotein CzcO